MSTRLSIEQAAFLLQRGEIVGFPTETVYGLGAHLFLEEAIKKIFVAKKRPQDNPLIVHIAHHMQLPLVAAHITEEAERLMEVFFPGPLTLIFEKQPAISPLVSAGLSTIGVRMPSHPIARALIDKVGAPLAAPSANLSGTPSSTMAQHVSDDFQGIIAGIVEGGSCSYGIESTVLMLAPRPILLRLGAICQQEIEEVLKKPVEIAKKTQERPLCPGMQHRHYAPKAPIILVFSEEELKAHLELYPHIKRVILRSLKQQTLYALLRSADLDHEEEIVVFCDSEMLQDPALTNRIFTAAQISTFE